MPEYQADSVFLFLYLLQVQKEYNLRLCFVHVNHGIRGSEADRDERFVEELCEQNGVMYKVFYKDIPKMAQEMSMTRKRPEEYIVMNALKMCVKSLVTIR